MPLPMLLLSLWHWKNRNSIDLHHRIAGSATLAIGLSLQESLGNLRGGILILVMRPFGIHDYIVSEGVEGQVLNIGLVYTTLLTVDNRRITI